MTELLSIIILSMRLTMLRRIIAILILLASIILLLWGVWHFTLNSHSIFLNPGDIEIPRVIGNYLQ